MKTLFHITDAINELLIRITLHSKNETIPRRTFTKWENIILPHELEQTAQLPHWLETMPKKWRLPSKVSYIHCSSLQLSIIG